MASERLKLPPVPSAARIIMNTDVCFVYVGRESRRRGGGKCVKLMVTKTQNEGFDN